VTGSENGLPDERTWGDWNFPCYMEFRIFHSQPILPNKGVMLSSSSYQPVKKSRFSEVDSLRAVACLAVIICHALATFRSGVGGDIWISKAEKSFGYFGVLVFFIISGYVIPFSLRGKRLAGVKRFAIRRFWRLYPPFWIALTLNYFANFDSFTVSDLAWGATMFPSLVGVGFIAGHFWTLEIELAFYVILASSWGGGGGLLLIFIVVIGLLWASPHFFDTGGHWGDKVSFLTLMFFGALCREVMSSKLGRMGRVLALGVITNLVCLYHLEEAIFDFLHRGYLRVNFPVIVLSAIFCFLFWVILRPVRLQWLAKVGRSTYSTYLFHWIIVYSLLAPMRKYLEVWMWPIYTAVAIVLSLLFGSLAYRWIEQPSDRIGKRIAG